MNITDQNSFMYSTPVDEIAAEDEVSACRGWIWFAVTFVTGLAVVAVIL